MSSIDVVVLGGESSRRTAVRAVARSQVLRAFTTAVVRLTTEFWAARKIVRNKGQHHTIGQQPLSQRLSFRSLVQVHVHARA